MDKYIIQLATGGRKGWKTPVLYLMDFTFQHDSSPFLKITSRISESRKYSSYRTIIDISRSLREYGWRCRIINYDEVKREAIKVIEQAEVINRFQLMDLE